MRLLVRSSAHRRLEGGGAEIAASPDTPGRERWLWDLRLDDPTTDGPDGAVRREATLRRGSEEVSRVALDVDPDRVVGEVDVHHLTEVTGLTRHVGELVAIFVGRGQVRVEGRHVLGELDALILEGDDPLDVALESEPEGEASVAVARVRYVDGSRVAWVP